jgi:hypothetical protein
MSPNKLVQAGRPDVDSTGTGFETGYDAEDFRGLPQCFQSNVRILVQARTRSLPSTFFTLRYSPIDKEDRKMFQRMIVCQ